MFVSRNRPCLVRETDYAYDRSGRLITQTGYTAFEAGAQHTVYDYAKSGVLTQTTYPDDTSLGGADRGFVTFHFDSALRLTRTNHQDNTNTDVARDVMGRPLTVTRGSEIDTFAYTPAGLLASAKRGTSTTSDAVSKVEREYDALMRLTRESQTIRQGTAHHIDYDYNLGGQVTERTYPDSTTFNYTYTDTHQVDTIERGTDVIADYSYEGYRPVELEMPTGGVNPVVQTHEYDGMHRLTRLSQSHDSTELATFAHAYDDAGNITQRTFEHRPSDPTEDYQYDTLHRLTRTDFGQRDGDPYESFIYDLLGNHLTQDHDGTLIAGTFNDANEQTERDSETLTWDLRGNLTEDDDGQQYAYDRSNMLTEVKDDQNNVIAEYAYDALGRRIEKSIPGGDTTCYYYDGNQLIEERDDSDVLQRQYVWGGLYIDELILFKDVAGEGGTPNADYIPLRHHNFNIVALINRTDGSVAERYDYNPYGTRTVLNPDFTEHTNSETGDFAFTMGHQGLMHDIESGLICNRARMLHPILGRFTQRDPLNHTQPGGGYHDGMSLYQYVRSTPLNRIDPSGLLSEGESEQFHIRSGTHVELSRRFPFSDRYWFWQYWVNVHYVWTKTDEGRYEFRGSPLLRPKSDSIATDEMNDPVDFPSIDETRSSILQRSEYTIQDDCVDCISAYVVAQAKQSGFSVEVDPGDIIPPIVPGLPSLPEQEIDLLDDATGTLIYRIDICANGDWDAERLYLTWDGDSTDFDLGAWRRVSGWR